ncbi:MAG TPA: phosphatidylinositol-specific phospholipase C/glycerophosphodiester phosphodiesterase family protein [Verrucomicrobiae bacterium]|nr:phosphatidylinositol-specific phospholipase C/glycerophosphodiester phosphodiesterase family protein [Verrucomicrobiae bacterium]
MRKLGFAIALVFCAFNCHAAPVPDASPVPLINAHAHNDYEHTRPLFEALEQGFCSVEADINLIDGKLLVAHNPKEAVPSRTLQSLYLDPLRAQVKKNGGHLYPGGPECTLLIDFKTDGKTTYEALRKVLKEYSDILSVFRDGKKQTKAITAVLTGGYPREVLAADRVRYAAGDGKLPDLDSNPPANLVVWISEDWKAHFKWDGTGTMAEYERKKLKQLAARAHEQGRRIRFWDAPDHAAFWKELRADGVDLINTDDLAGLAKFLNAEH